MGVTSFQTTSAGSNLSAWFWTASKTPTIPPTGGIRSGFLIAKADARIIFAVASFSYCLANACTNKKTVWRQRIPSVCTNRPGRNPFFLFYHFLDTTNPSWYFDNTATKRSYCDTHCKRNPTDFFRYDQPYSSSKFFMETLSFRCTELQPKEIR